MKKIISVVGARPNFMKVAPVHNALKQYPDIRHLICHTGQHYDEKMSKVFFEDLELPQPEFYLGVGSGTHAEQTARVMVEFEKVIDREHPDLVIVVGDVNSTIACSLVAAKALVPIAHVEAGLRSFDRTMPEEINRIATDAIVDLLWTPSPDGDEHLLAEGIAPEKIERVGNIMIDSFELMRPRIDAANMAMRLGREPHRYGVVTLHRPSNVDAKGPLTRIVDELIAVSSELPLVFPVHPRTRSRLAEFGLQSHLESASQIQLVEPMAYIEFMSLVVDCALAITDSGGIQEETSYLGIPCFTLRDNTERPITITEGTNRLVNAENLRGLLRSALDSRPQRPVIALWDGKTAARVASNLKRRAESGAN